MPTTGQEELRDKLADFIRDYDVELPYHVASAIIRFIEDAGFVVVPKEPTSAMREAGYACVQSDDEALNAYHAMVAASPNLGENE